LQAGRESEEYYNRYYNYSKVDHDATVSENDLKCENENSYCRIVKNKDWEVQLSERRNLLHTIGYNKLPVSS